MPIAESLTPEFDHEVANTRRVLERVPTEQFAWKPHEKSYSLGVLATHVASIPSWAKWTFTTDELDIAPADGPSVSMPKCASTADLLAALDQSASEARQAMTGMSDADWMKPWSLKATGKVLFTLPRIAVYRGMVMNHGIHHRGQLTVYLRLCGVPLPSIYGPTADEPGGF